MPIHWHTSRANAHFLLAAIQIKKICSFNEFKNQAKEMKKKTKYNNKTNRKITCRNRANDDEERKKNMVLDGMEIIQSDR